MAAERAGRLFYEHIGDIALTSARQPGIFTLANDFLQSWQPVVQALVDGQGARADPGQSCRRSALLHRRPEAEPLVGAVATRTSGEHPVAQPIEMLKIECVLPECTISPLTGTRTAELVVEYGSPTSITPLSSAVVPLSQADPTACQPLVQS